MPSKKKFQYVVVGRAAAVRYREEYMDEDQDSPRPISPSDLQPLTLGPSSIILQAATPSSDREDEEPTILLSPTRSTNYAVLYKKNKNNTKSKKTEVNPKYLHPDWKKTEKKKEEKEEEEEEKEEKPNVVDRIRVDPTIGSEISDDRRWLYIGAWTALSVTIVAVPALIFWLKS